MKSRKRGKTSTQPQVTLPSQLQEHGKKSSRVWLACQWVAATFQSDGVERTNPIVPLITSLRLSQWVIIELCEEKYLLEAEWQGLQQQKKPHRTIPRQRAPSHNFLTNYIWGCIDPVTVLKFHLSASNWLCDLVKQGSGDCRGLVSGGIQLIIAVNIDWFFFVLHLFGNLF